MLLRAGATIQPRYAADPTPDLLQEIEDMNERHEIRIAYARELSFYFREVLAAGGFAKYDRSRRAPFVAMLERVGAFPIPNEMIAIVCAFWLRAGEYYGGSDADARGENLENLRAMLAESDDDEELPS